MSVGGGAVGFFLKIDVTGILNGTSGVNPSISASLPLNIKKEFSAPVK